MLFSSLFVKGARIARAVPIEMTVTRFRKLAALLFATTLGACKYTVLDPAGDIAMRQRDLLIDSTLLMLLIIVPVMALTVWFAWRYRAGNKQARYEPDWEHSTHLELVIWATPLAIIICLGALTWLDTHLLDPYRALNRIAPNKAVEKSVEPLQVEVVALDWKWLFIYPQYGVASVNELAAPVDRPIAFSITAASVMNSFYIPALAGQVYAMPGMETKLQAVINKPGSFLGFSANYSGAGFSGMHFAFLGQPESDFNDWIARARSGGGKLDRAAYTDLAKPSENEPVHRYAAIDPELFNAVVTLCVVPDDAACMSGMKAAASDLNPAHMNNNTDNGIMLMSNPK